jgi:amino acid transporter
MMEKHDSDSPPAPDVEHKAMGETAHDVNFRNLTDGTPDLVHQHDQLQRGLKSRHIQFLALGGA